MVRHIDDYASDMFQCELVSDLTYIALGILVFISGYSLAISSNILNSMSDIKSFFIKRIFRIYPLYSVALLIFYLFSIVNVTQLYSGLLLYNLFTGERILTLWYISMIMLFYIVFIAINYKASIMRFWLISMFIFILLMIEKIIVNKVDGTIILYYPSFICGILAAKYASYVKTNMTKSIFLYGIFLIMLILKPFAPSKLNIIIVTIMIISFMLSSFFMFSRIKLHNITTKIIINLSYASFCMYLFHRIIFKASLFIYKPIMGINTLLYLYLIAIPIIYFASFYIQNYYDKSLKYCIMGSKRDVF